MIVRLSTGEDGPSHVENIALTSTMLASPEWPTPRAAPLIHAQREPRRVGIWPPEQVSRMTLRPTIGRRLPLVITPKFSNHPIRFWAMMRKYSVSAAAMAGERHSGAMEPSSHETREVKSCRLAPLTRRKPP
jgi:hypothetical protein